MNKAIKYRIYPTEEQAVFFMKTFGCCRKVWNLILSDKIKSYKETGSFGKHTPAMYKDEYPFLKEVDSLALANTNLNLLDAMKSCFDKTRKKNTGFPKFKSAKYSKMSYRTNNQKGTVALAEKAIKLPKIGYIKAKIHRMPKKDWVLKSATISKEKDGKFYASVLFEFEEPEIKRDIDFGKAIGLDYKSDGLFMDSNGNIGSNHKYFTESQKKLAKEQKKLSHMIEAHIVGYKIIKGYRHPIYDRPLKDCKNIQKQKEKVAKIHTHIANQRKDNLHKTSTKIANLYDVVCIESLNMKAMANKGFGNGKATLDNGYGMFVEMLKYKLHDRGKILVAVSKWYPSSQLCNCCGRRKKLSLDKRVYECSCGYVEDRDINAAKNILDEGLRILKTA